MSPSRQNWGWTLPRCTAKRAPPSSPATPCPKAPSPWPRPMPATSSAASRRVWRWPRAAAGRGHRYPGPAPRHRPEGAPAARRFRAAATARRRWARCCARCSSAKPCMRWAFPPRAHWPWRARAKPSCASCRCPAPCSHPRGCQPSFASEPSSSLPARTGSGDKVKALAAGLRHRPPRPGDLAGRPMRRDLAFLRCRHRSGKPGSLRRLDGPRLHPRRDEHRQHDDLGRDHRLRPLRLHGSPTTRPRCSAASTTAVATPMATSPASRAGTWRGWPRPCCRWWPMATTKPQRTRPWPRPRR